MEWNEECSERGRVMIPDGRRKMEDGRRKNTYDGRSKMEEVRLLK